MGLSGTGCTKTSFSTFNFFRPILPFDDTCSVEVWTFFEWFGTATRRVVFSLFEVSGAESAECRRLVDDMVYDCTLFVPVTDILGFAFGNKHSLNVMASMT